MYISFSLSIYIYIDLLYNSQTGLSCRVSGGELGQSKVGRAAGQFWTLILYVFLQCLSVRGSPLSSEMVVTRTIAYVLPIKMALEPSRPHLAPSGLPASKMSPKLASWCFQNVSKTMFQITKDDYSSPSVSQASRMLP